MRRAMKPSTWLARCGTWPQGGIRKRVLLVRCWSVRARSGSSANEGVRGRRTSTPTRRGLAWAQGEEDVRDDDADDEGA